jgi:Na+-driven multidrug efflux pump
MEAAKRVAKNTGILYIRMAITVFISLYSTRLILAALGVADFGLFNLVGGVISMLGFLNSSMAAATQRFMSFAQGAGDLEKVKRIFNMSSLLHWGIAILVLLLLEGAGYFFFHGILNIAPDRLEVAKLIYQFMVISTIFTVVSVPYEAVITSHENMLVYAVMGVIEAVLKLGITLYITYSAMDHLVMYGILMAVLSIVLLIIKRIYCHRVYEECHLHVKQYYDKPLLKEMGGFAGWSLLGSATSMGAFYGQTIVLNMFFGTLVNAAQAIAGQISGQLGVFAITLTKVLNPLIDKSEGAKDRKMLFLTVFKGTKISFYLLAFLYIPFLIEMPFILKIWLKNVPEYTIIFCRVLLLRNLIEQLYIPMINAISAQGNIKLFQIMNSVLNLTPIVMASIFFYLGYSPYYLYYSFLIFSLLQFLLVLYFSNKNLNFPITDFYNQVIKKTFLPFFYSLFSTLIPSFFIKIDLLRLFLITSIGLISFLYFVYHYGLDYTEKVIIQNFFLNFKKKSLLIKTNTE